MRIVTWTLSSVFLLAEANVVLSSALLHIPAFKRHNDISDLMRKASEHYEGDLERRSPQSSSTDGDLSLSTPTVERNASTLQACTTGMQSMTAVANEAGFAACYNILDWHENLNGMFQADLRFFQFANATGQFANVPMSAITVQLDYPNSTQFSILMNAKRSTAGLERRQSASNYTQIQQYSLVGNFQMQLDLKKINETQLMSLLIPQIMLSASVNGTTITSQVASSDTVYFVAGEFSTQATPQLAEAAANPIMAAAAITASKGFVLPGTTFGIFPTGLIVTGAWSVMFLLAFGIGTIGRIWHRDIYRKRVAATSGRKGKR